MRDEIAIEMLGTCYQPAKLGAKYGGLLLALKSDVQE
jgi:hypothetical protein